MKPTLRHCFAAFVRPWAAATAAAKLGARAQQRRARARARRAFDAWYSVVQACASEAREQTSALRIVNRAVRRRAAADEAAAQRAFAKWLSSTESAAEAEARRLLESRLQRMLHGVAELEGAQAELEVEMRHTTNALRVVKEETSARAEAERRAHEDERRAREEVAMADEDVHSRNVELALAAALEHAAAQDRAAAAKEEAAREAEREAWRATVRVEEFSDDLDVESFLARWRRTVKEGQAVQRVAAAAFGFAVVSARAVSPCSTRAHTLSDISGVVAASAPLRATPTQRRTLERHAVKDSLPRQRAWQRSRQRAVSMASVALSPALQRRAAGGAPRGGTSTKRSRAGARRTSSRV